MKFRSLKKWEHTEDLGGLIFFAQLLEELLFDYSLDTYKPSAMNSSTLCIEAISLIRDIESNIIDKSNLSHILKELLTNLKSDEVAIHLIPIKYESIFKKLSNEKTTTTEINTLLQLIYSHIKLDKYKQKTEELLQEAVKNPSEKDRIRALTRNYVTTLINTGYSTQFLYPCARMYFYWNNNKISTTEDIKGFINLVSGNPQEYAAIFKANSLFNEIKDSCKAFDIQITQELPEEIFVLTKQKLITKKKDEVFLIDNKIKAMDVHSARDIAERTMEKISTLYGIFHHKEEATWDSNPILINLETKKHRVVPRSNNPMLMCADSRKEDAASKLNDFINNFSLEKKSFSKFNRATDLHSLALRSDSPENQLLNLWIGLETIVPSNANQQKAKINNIIDSILPFLSLVYIDILVEKLIYDLSIWRRSVYLDAIKDINGKNEKIKILKLLILSENSEKREFLFSELRDFHLLRNRAHYFSKIFTSSSKISKVIETHWQRVDWQIRRIYRTRNLIVHAGHTPSYIGVLIKNSHDYLDITLKIISKLACDKDKFNSIDGIFKYIEMRFNEYINQLKKSDINTDKDNIEELIFPGILEKDQ